MNSSNSTLKARGYRSTDINDFPDNMKHSLDTGRPFYLRQQAAEISLALEGLIRMVLSPNVYTNDRRARAIIEYSRNYPAEIVEKVSRHITDNFTSVTSGDYRDLLAKYHQAITPDPEIPMSEETGSFVRSPEYFTHQ